MLGYAHYATKPEESFNIPTETFEEQLAINSTSVFLAIREMVAGSAKLAGPKTFIFTGNQSNEGGVPGWLSLGVGKVSSAYMIELADNVYREQDFRYEHPWDFWSDEN